MELADILHWLTDEAGKLAGREATAAVHTAIDDLLGSHTAEPVQAPPAASPAPPAAAADPGTGGTPGAAVASVPAAAEAPYPGPPGQLDPGAM